MAAGLLIGLSLIDFSILIFILRSALHLAKYTYYIYYSHLLRFTGVLIIQAD